MSFFEDVLLPHGGRVRAAAQAYGIAEQDWLDVSTGINPEGWPVPVLPASVWARLPEPDDGLESMAARAFNAAAVLAVAGSQAAIMALPRLRAPCRVAVLRPCYAEHAAAWQRAGHQVSLLAVEALEAAANTHDVLVLANPNNPTGALLAPARLLRWRQALAARGGWLVVDEAFMDALPEHSLCAYSQLPGILVRAFAQPAGLRFGLLPDEQALQRLDHALTALMHTRSETSS